MSGKNVIQVAEENKNQKNVVKPPEKSLGMLQYEKGMKISKGSCCTKPDPESASTTLMLAGKALQKEQNHPAAAEAFYQAGSQFARMTYDLEAAVYTKEAVKEYIICLQLNQLSQQPDFVAELAQKAAVHFERAGNPTEAARSMMYGCRFLKTDKQRELLEKAKTLFKIDGKPAHAAATMMEFIESLVDDKMYREACLLCDQARPLYKDMKGYEYKEDVLTLMQIILLVELRDYLTAEQFVDKFANINSYECHMATDLIIGMREHDYTSLTKATKNDPARRNLSNQFLFLLRKASDEWDKNEDQNVL